MRTQKRHGSNFADSGKRANLKSIRADSAGATTSDTHHARANGGGPEFAPGDRVYVKGMGNRAFGTVCAGRAIPGYLSYRCDFNQGEYLVKASNVRAIGKKRDAAN